LVAFGAIATLEEAREHLDRLQHSGGLDPDFARANLGFFRFSEYTVVSRPTSLIIVAVQRPAHMVTFVVNGGEFEAILPPTYYRYSLVPEEIREDLLANALPPGIHVEILSAPLKSLAARLGLVQYGRNNVTYVPKFGSYFQLAGFITDIDLGSVAKNPMPPRAMPACRRCHVCRAACPTGAIDDSRFLLHAERCLTLSSEDPGEFPVDSFSPSNSCLVGCLDCQEGCPVNRGRLQFEPTGVDFDAAETAAILVASSRSGTVWESIRAKLRRLGLFDCEAVLSRNLRALLCRRGVISS
jgi:epoxyqueuosine reductase